MDIVGVEVKSLMIDPKAPFTDLNSVLRDRITRFGKSLSVKGSISAILVPPYSNDSTKKIEFDLKQATDDINDSLDGTHAALIFIVNENKDGRTIISTQVHLVEKSPNIVNDNPIDTMIVRIPFCKFKNS